MYLMITCKIFLDQELFCLYKDVEKLKSAGLAQGGSLQNAIVVGEKKF